MFSIGARSGLSSVRSFAIMSRFAMSSNPPESFPKPIQNVSRLPVDLWHMNRNEVWSKVIDTILNDPDEARKLWATYGSEATGLDASVSWPSVEKLREDLEDEEKYDLSLDERLRIVEERRMKRDQEREIRQNTIAKKMEKLPEIMLKFEQEKKKRLTSAEDVDSERNQLLEDAHDYYGFPIDPSDRRMQLMLEELEEQKSLEAKQVRKAEKVKETEKALQDLIKEAEKQADKKTTSNK